MPPRLPTTRREMVLTRRTYTQLVKDLRVLIAKGKLRAEEAVGRELVETYHALGERILAAKLTDSAGYADALLKRLSQELALDERLLRRALAFARLYPKLPDSKRRLRWSHYRELLSVKDAGARGFYEAQAAKQRWSRDKLVQAIRAQQYKRLLPGVSASPKKKRTIVLPRPGGAHHVYKAQVEHVVDGETLMVMIDLGFHLYKRQRVRLALVDAPALREAKGKAARAFVQEALGQAEFVMIKTVSHDHHGRYTAHVFYEPQSRDEGRIFTEGHHLNQELVARGLAAAL